MPSPTLSRIRSFDGRTVQPVSFAWTCEWKLTCHNPHSFF
jgi:hypothetical protein